MTEAQVAELADALASGASVRKDMGVQISPWAQHHTMKKNTAAKKGKNVAF